MRPVVIAFLLFPGFLHAQSYSDLIKRAESAFVNEDLTLAAAIYDSAFVRFKPDNNDIYNASCVNSLNGKATKAVQLLKKAFDSGYDGFDWMYYDKDLDPIRNDPAYVAFERQYRPDSVVFFFEIIRDLQRSENILTICDKRISINEGQLAKYSLDEIRSRAGVDLKLLQGDTLFDFSNKDLFFCRAAFRNPQDAYNVISRVNIGTLIVSDCKGNLKLLGMEATDLLLYEDVGKENYIRNLMIDSVRITGVVNLNANGFQFFIRNSVFDLSPDDGDEVGMIWNLDYQRINITNTAFNARRPGIDPFDLNVIESKRLSIEKTRFNHPIRLRGNIADILDISGNKFPAYVDLLGLQLPAFNSYIPFSQFRDTKLLRISYDQREVSLIRGDSTTDLSDNVLFDNLTGLYKRLYDSYRARADISSANAAYVRMKDLEINHLKMMRDRTSEETMRLRLNQLMGFYTDHATSPGKALIISFYIILAFGVFYCFFPSDWDKTSKGQLVDDYKRFIEKNEHGYVKPFFRMVKGILLSLLNAVALSMNAFITLGFGNIPTTGIARYMCIIQGMLGWFLLSLFTVALLNQVLL